MNNFDNSTQNQKVSDKKINQALFHQYRELLDQESKKPIAEQDKELILECINGIREIEGKETITEDEIQCWCGEIIKNNTEAVGTELRHRLRLMITVAVIVILIFACAISAMVAIPAFHDWVIQILNSNKGTSVTENGVAYTNQGEKKYYPDIVTLMLENGLDLYYPKTLPDGVSISEVRMMAIGEANMVAIMFNKDDLDLTISLNSDESLISTSSEKITINQIDFYLQQENSLFIANTIIDNNIYAISAGSEDELYIFLNGMGKNKYHIIYIPSHQFYIINYFTDRTEKQDYLTKS